jgi:hypothetical protein
MFNIFLDNWLGEKTTLLDKFVFEAKLGDSTFFGTLITFISD